MSHTITNRRSYSDVLIPGSQSSTGVRIASRTSQKSTTPITAQDTLISLTHPCSSDKKPQYNSKKFPSVSSSKKALTPSRDKSILHPQKQGIVRTIWSIFFGAQTSTVAISGGALSQGASLTKLLSHASNSVGIGYFFYKIGSFVNTAVKFSKKITLFRMRKFAQESINLGSATLGAVVSAAKFGWIAIRAASLTVGQLVFGAFSIAKSLLSVIDMVRFAKAKKQLSQLSSQREKKELSFQLKKILASTKVMRSYLKNLFPNASSLDQFNNLVNQDPISALAILKRSATQGLIKEVISLTSNLCFSVAAIVGIFFPPVGLILTAIGGIFLAIDWIIGKVVAKTAVKELIQKSLQV